MTVIPLEMSGGLRGRNGAYHDRHARLSVGSRILARLGEWRRRARDRAELASLDDRMLRDVGLTRADAEFLSNKPFWQE